jgi:uncharacterized protein YbjQ (UPF0145 family)
LLGVRYSDTSTSSLPRRSWACISAGLRNIVGGRSKSYEGEVAKAVAQVMDELKAGGEKLAADAILSIDIDYETVGDNMLMVAASGTAVKLG